MSTTPLLARLTLALMLAAMCAALPLAVPSASADDTAPTATAPSGDDLWSALRDRRADVRATARTILINSANADDAGDYATKLQSPDAREREVAVELLAAVGTAEHMPALIDRLDDDALAVSAAAYRALLRLAVGGQMETLREIAAAREGDLFAPEALERLVFVLDVVLVLDRLDRWATAKHPVGRRFAGMHAPAMRDMVAKTEQTGITAPIATLCRFLEDTALTDFDLAPRWTLDRARVMAVRALTDVRATDAVPSMKALLARLGSQDMYGNVNAFVVRRGRVIRYSQNSSDLSIALQTGIHNLSDNKILRSWFEEQEQYLSQGANPFGALQLYRQYYEVHDLRRALRCLKIAVEFKDDSNNWLVGYEADAHFALAAMLARMLQQEPVDGLVSREAWDASKPNPAMQESGIVFWGGWGDAPSRLPTLDEITWPTDPDELTELVLKHLELAFEYGFRDDTWLERDFRFQALAENKKFQQLRSVLRKLYPPDVADNAFDATDQWD